MTTDITNIWKFDLRRGNSPNPREGACLLDAVSWLEYGTLDDHPECVCPVVAAFARDINDAMGDVGRQRLKVFIPRLVGTADPASERERGEYLAWQAIRVFAPLALDAAGLHAHATVLRNLSGTLGAAAEAAEAARAAAAAAAQAADWEAASDDEMIAALAGVLAIGRQAEQIEPARIASSVRRFELAQGITGRTSI